jgi:hypothetical protein
VKKVKSSHVLGYHYDPVSKKLTVQFKNGHVYDYEGVHMHEFAALEQAESPGQHLHKHIFNVKRGTKQ